MAGRVPIGDGHDSDDVSSSLLRWEAPKARAVARFGERFLRAGDCISYYNPIYVALPGEEPHVRKAQVLAVDPLSETPLSLNTEEPLQMNTNVRWDTDIDGNPPHRQQWRQLYTHSFVSSKIDAPTLRSRLGPVLKAIVEDTFREVVTKGTASWDTRVTSGGSDCDDLHDHQNARYCGRNEMDDLLHRATTQDQHHVVSSGDGASWDRLRAIEPNPVRVGDVALTPEVILNGGEQREISFQCPSRSGLHSRALLARYNPGVCQVTMTLPCHPAGESFNTKDLAIQAVDTFAKPHGYSVEVKRNKRDRKGIMRRYTLACDRHSETRNTRKLTSKTRKKEFTRSRRCNCPMEVVVFLNAENEWEIKYNGRENLHNHHPSGRHVCLHNSV